MSVQLLGKRKEAMETGAGAPWASCRKYRNKVYPNHITLEDDKIEK